MFKKSLLLLVMLSFVSSAFAEELKDDCEAAVDSADRLNADANKHCDYSKTGLNGVLHKAFAKKSDDSEGGEIKQAADTAVTKNVLSRSLSREFDSAQQLMIVRYELLQVSAQQCVKGFVIESERYLPVNAQRLKLEFDFHCL